MLSNLEFKVFLEGYEVPFFAGEISCGSMVANAGIQIPPSESTRKFLPKTRILILFKSSSDTEEKVLFDGEVQDIRFDKEATSRTTSIYATDCFQELNYFPAYIMTPASNETDLIMNAYYTGGQIQVIPINFSAYLKSDEIQNIKDLRNKIFKLLSNALKGSVVFSSQISPHKFLSRLMILVSQKTETYLAQDFVKSALFQLMNISNEVSSVAELIAKLCQVLDLTYYSAFPGFYTGKNWYNFLMLPNLYFASVPDCNVLHYNIINTFTIATNWQIRPTRMMWKVPLTESSAINPTAQLVSSGTSTEEKPASSYFFGIRPKSLLTQMLSKDKKTINQIEYYKHFANNIEQARGMVEKFISDFPFAPTSVDSEDPISDQKKIIYLDKKMDYEFQKAQYEASTFLAAGPFNPYAIAGLPMLFIDDTKEATGRLLLLGIRHSFTFNSATTSYQGGYYHEIDDPNTVPPDYYDIVKPKYLYETLIQTKMSEYEKKVDKIFNLNAEEIYKNIIKRPLMTFKEYLKFFDLKYEKNIITGNIFNKTRQDRIKKYINSIKGNVILK